APRAGKRPAPGTLADRLTVLRKHFRLADLGNHEGAWEATELSKFPQGLRPEPGRKESGDLNAGRNADGASCAGRVEFAGAPPGCAFCPGGATRPQGLTSNAGVSS